MDIGQYLIRQYSKLPDLLKEKIPVILGYYETQSEDIKEKGLQELKKTQLYKANAFDENFTLKSIYKIDILQALVSLLKGDTEKYNLFWTLFCGKINFSLSDELVQKQVELKLNTYFHQEPFQIMLNTQQETDIDRYLHKNINLTPDQILSLTLLNDFFRFSKLNHEINNISKWIINDPHRKSRITQQFKTERNKTLVNLIMNRSYSLTNGFYKDAPSAVLNELYQDLKNYVNFLNGEEGPELQEIIISRLNCIKSKLDIRADQNEITTEILKKSQSLEFVSQTISQLEKEDISCIKDKINSEFQMLKQWKKNIHETIAEHPLIITSFIIPNCIVKHRSQDFLRWCCKYNTQLVYSNSPFLVMLREQGNKTQVNLLSLNLDSDKQVNNVLVPIKAEYIFKKLKQKYFLPTYPLQLPALLIGEYLKNSTKPNQVLKEQSNIPHRGLP